MSFKKKVYNAVADHDIDDVICNTGGRLVLMYFYYNYNQIVFDES